MNRHQSKRFFPHSFLLAAVFGAFVLPMVALAAPSFDLSPHVIDAKGKDREISHYAVTLKNLSAAIQSVYVWAVDVDEVRGDLGRVDDGSMVPVETSPSKWVDISRSIQVLPNEEQSVPLQLQIPVSAKPGNYHVLLRFGSATTQSDAMSCADCQQELTLNIEVTEDIREKLQLSSFTSLKNVFTGSDAAFNLAVENTGNRTVIPSGKVRIFDNNGKEVGLVDLNAEGKQVEPKGSELMGAVWAAGGHFGKYKAMLDMSYGQRGTMQDVVYFWVVPWGSVAGFLALIAAVCGLAVFVTRGRRIARPSYAYARATNEPEGSVIEEEETYSAPEMPTRRTDDSLVSRIGPREHAAPTVLDDSMRRANMSMTAGLTEVSIPPRTHTVPPALRLSQKQHFVSEEHQIRLR